MMSRLSTRIFSQNTTIWSPHLTPQSPRRSTSCRLNDSCRRPTKIRRLRNNTNLNCIRTINKRIKLPLYRSRIMRNYHNRLYLFTPDRPQVPNRLLISKPHGPCSRRYSNPNPMRIYWCTYSYNCTRLNLLRPLLLSKHQLRTNTQPYYSFSSRTTNSPSPNSNMMIPRLPG